MAPGITEFDIKYTDQVIEIENESFSTPWVSAGFIEELEIPGSFNFLALDDCDQVIGYIVFRILLDEVHLLKIAVRREKRKLGTAGKLIERLYDIAYLKKALIIYLEVSAVNRPAIDFYKKNGFVGTGRRPGYYGTEDAINMEKNLYDITAYGMPLDFKKNQQAL